MRSDVVMGLRQSSGALITLLRHDIRARWKRVLAVALMLGAAGGLVAGAAIGAHRTSTAYERFLVTHRAFDVSALENLGTCAFDPTAELDCDLDHLAALPLFDAVGRFTVLYADVLTEDGRSVGDAFTAHPGLQIVVPGEGFGSVVSRSKLLEGREPQQPDEVLLGVEIAERFGLHVGDHLQFSFYVHSPGDPDPIFGSAVPAPPQTMRVVGIGVSPGEIAPPSGPFVAMIQLTRSFVVDAEAVTTRGLAAILHDDVNFDDLVFAAADRRLVADAATDIADQAEAIQREIRPQAVSLTLIALLGGIAGFAVLGQLLARYLRGAASDHRTLSDIGCGRRELVLLGTCRALTIALIAAATAGIVAICMSPLMPIGVARVAEPDPGLQFAPLGVFVGAASTGLLVLLAAAAPTWRLANNVRMAPPARRPREFIGRVAPGPVLSTGTRFAFERGGGANALPLGSSLLASAFGVTALAAALVFASGLDHLLETPRLTGWNWDVTVDYPQVPSEDGGEDVDAESLMSVLAENPDIESFALGTTQQAFPNYELRVGAEQLLVPMISIAGYDIGPTVIEGRAPTSPDEILLGPETLDDLGVSIGETIEVWGRAYATDDVDEHDVVIEMTVVGSGVIPVVEASTRVGRGAAVTYDGLRRLREEPFDSPGYYDTLFVNLRDGAQAESLAPEIFSALGVLSDGETKVTTWDQPQQLLAIQPLRAAPLGVAALMAALALASLVHLLLSTIRLRRNDIAILKCLGMEPGQMRRAVAWQASITSLSILAIGVPVGIVAGRFAWLAFVEDFGAAPESVVPVFQMALVTMAALIAVNLAALWPARRAAHHAPAEALRAG